MTATSGKDWIARAKLTPELVAVDARQADVDQREMEPEPRHALERMLAGRRREHDEAVALEPLRPLLGERDMVFDDEHTRV